MHVLDQCCKGDSTQMSNVSVWVQGIKPKALERVHGPELRGLIETCIAHEPQQRPQARMLLKHPFFESLRAVRPMGLAPISSCTLPVHLKLQCMMGRGMIACLAGCLRLT